MPRCPEGPITERAGWCSPCAGSATTWSGELFPVVGRARNTEADEKQIRVHLWSSGVVYNLLIIKILLELDKPFISPSIFLIGIPYLFLRTYADYKGVML